jgi:endonuclease/exonuclease/phosphatase family metal-dependent hydrolase
MVRPRPEVAHLHGCRNPPQPLPRRHTEVGGCTVVPADLHHDKFPRAGSSGARQAAVQEHRRHGEGSLNDRRDSHHHHVPHPIPDPVPYDLKPPSQIPDSFSIASWNCRTLFGSTQGGDEQARRQRAKWRTVVELAKLFLIVVLQETHGSEHDLNSLRNVLPRHLIVGSFTASGRGGGLVFILDSALADLFRVQDIGQLAVVHVVPGRVALLRLPATTQLQALDVMNIHFELEMATGDVGFYAARIGLANAVLRAIAPRHIVHTILAGDWNSTASDEPRLNPIEGSFYPGRCAIAKHLEAGLVGFTELYQPHYTRRGMSGGVITNLSRIDRIYSNGPTCELLDRHPVVATYGIVTNTLSPSDHIPITVKFFPAPAGPPVHSSIPAWVAKHKFFPSAVAQLWRTACHVPGGPMARLAVAKEVLHAAATITKAKAGEIGFESTPERLHWALSAFRGIRAGAAGLPHLRRAAAAFPDLIPWLPGGINAGDLHKLGDMVADLAAKSLNTDILEAIADEGPPSTKGRTRLSKMHALAATWRSQRRRLSLATIVDTNGIPQARTEDAAKLLEQFWEPIFRAKTIDPEAALRVMPFTPKVPEGLAWRVDRTIFRELVACPRDGAPGPDGLPYSAWRCAGIAFSDILFEAYEAFMDGEPLPADFNECLLVFIPKGDEPGDRGTVVRSPDLVRPISLSSTASKFFALAVNRPLAEAARVTVHPRQRGFVGGRSITDNIIEIEGFAQSYTIAEAEDPAILLFDIKAAFPSLAHQWLFVVLIRMGIPKSFIRSVKALYCGGVAVVVLQGARWGRFPILSGIRQGCPASGSLFALAIDPCFRYIMDKLGPGRGILTAYADDIAAAVKELFEALPILASAFAVVGRCSALELHPGKVVIIPLWKFDEMVVRTAVSVAAPSLAAAVIRNYGKLLGILLGPGAPLRQWMAVGEELRNRSRFLASLGMAWSGTLPLFRSHVLPVASHVAQMCSIPKEMFRAEAGCLAIALKIPYQSIPVTLLRSGQVIGLSYNVPDLHTLGKAATFRAAETSGVLAAVLAEHRRARRSRLLTLSPFLRDWTHAGVVGHMRDTHTELQAVFDRPPPVGRGIQAWAVKELRKKFHNDLVDQVLARRTSAMTGSPVSLEVASRLRARLFTLHAFVPQVVQSSMVRSICNAWTTTGRFSGPRLPCPFGCLAIRGDRWTHFPACSAVRRMWTTTCPSVDNIFFSELPLESVLLLSPRLAPDVVVQLALWSDVVGHCANEIRALGTAPAQVLADGHEMMAARLRFLAVQSDCTRSVIRRVRAASPQLNT